MGTQYGDVPIMILYCVSEGQGMSVEDEGCDDLSHLGAPIRAYGSTRLPITSFGDRVLQRVSKIATWRG